MANLGREFDASKVEPSQSMELMPAGEYTAAIVSSEMMASKNNSNNHYLKLKFQIIDGEQKGRVIFSNLNLINSNETAVSIAQRDLSAICHAVGVLNIQDSEELHDKPLNIKIGIKPAQDGYDAQNEIKGYLSKKIIKTETTNQPWKV
ncbi:MAG: DUF669 domain-containing protein [Proteobacteria bacterium]|nr:DUF669 domain-containing protein [Pseudomonadota bacterium]